MPMTDFDLRWSRRDRDLLIAVARRVGWSVSSNKENYSVMRSTGYNTSVHVCFRVEEARVVVTEVDLDRKDNNESHIFWSDGGLVEWLQILLTGEVPFSCRGAK